VTSHETSGWPAATLTRSAVSARMRRGSASRAGSPGCGTGRPNRLRPAWSRRAVAGCEHALRRTCDARRRRGGWHMRAWWRVGRPATALPTASPCLSNRAALALTSTASRRQRPPRLASCAAIVRAKP